MAEVKKLQFSEGTSTTAPTDLPIGAGYSADIFNLSLTVSVASSALTIAVKTKAGNNASSSDLISASFRESSETSCSFVNRTITAALSVVVSSGSTLGHSSALPFPIYVYLIDNAGTVELGVSSTFLDDGRLQTSTAEGGAGAADSLTGFYSTTARTSKAVRLIAKLISTQATAGTWAAVPTVQQLQTNTLIANPNEVGKITSFVPIKKSSTKEINDTAYAILDTDGYDLIYSSTTMTASRAVTLPTLADNIGREIELKKLDSSVYQLLLDGEGSETIDGFADWPLIIQGDFIRVRAEASGWCVVAKNAVSKWLAFTPTNSWTTNVSSNTGTYRRVGQNIEVKVRIAFSGAPDAGALTMTLPNSWAIDTAATFADVWDMVGQGTTNDSSSQYYSVGVFYATTTTISILCFNITSTYLAPATYSKTAPFTVGSGDYVQYKFTVPISGWRA
jgi:hypothetical protein